MRQYLFAFLLLSTTAGIARTQLVAVPNDVLGAHLNYGRGCAACHAPHSGANGNGASKSGDARGGDVALWGQDSSSLYGKTIATDGGKYVEVLPTSMSATTPDASGMLACLTCHDGNYAEGAMMKNAVYEKLPSTYGNADKVPTLLGNNGAGQGNYLNEHPMGLSAAVACGGTGWDCTKAGGVISMKGPASSRFVSNYGFFVELAAYNGNAVVMCTTCHNPHAMNAVKVIRGAMSGLPAGTYATMFFLRAPYNPADPNHASNQTSQFCRQCHGEESNEMYGGTAGTVF
jgi:hypothetical protein